MVTVSFFLGTRVPSHQLPFSSTTASTRTHVVARFPSNCFGVQTYSTPATVLLTELDVSAENMTKLIEIEGTHKVAKLPRFPMLFGIGPLSWLRYKDLKNPNKRHNNNTFSINKSGIFELHLSQNNR